MNSREILVKAQDPLRNTDNDELRTARAKIAVAITASLMPIHREE
jgi:hypothetical protein